MKFHRSLNERIVNSENYRKSYLSDDDTYQDFMGRIPYQAVKEQFESYPESEDQQSYKSENSDDEDYQSLENTFQPGSVNFPFPLSAIAMNNGVPDAKKTCLEVWNNLMTPKYTKTGYNEYSKVCPTTFIHNYCCGGKIWHGPHNNELNSGESFTFYYTMQKNKRDDGKCDYEAEAKRGTSNGLTYTAPTLSGSEPFYDDIFIKPRTGSDLGRECIKIKVKIKPPLGCAGETIGLGGTIQMETGESQAMTVVGAISGKTYTWALTGGGNLSSTSGTSVTYTAPSSNANCSSNPTIQLKSGLDVCDTVYIAVNGAGSSYTAAHQDWTKCTCVIVDGTARYSASSTNWDCAGIASDASPSASMTGSETSCNPNWCASYVTGPVVDVRTSEALAAGCCPYKLL